MFTRLVLPCGQVVKIKRARKKFSCV